MNEGLVFKNDLVNKAATRERCNRLRMKIHCSSWWEQQGGEGERQDISWCYSLNTWLGEAELVERISIAEGLLAS